MFTPYRLARYGTVWRPHRFYEDAFLTAFPLLVSEPPNDIIAPEQTLRSCYTWRALMHFAGFPGVAVVEPVSDKLLCHDYRVKALPVETRATYRQSAFAGERASRHEERACETVGLRLG